MKYCRLLSGAGNVRYLPYLRTDFLRAAERRDTTITVEKVFSWILQDFASLQLTVILFLLGIFVIWVGTTAQADADIWQVVDRYFRSFFMEV